MQKFKDGIITLAFFVGMIAILAGVMYINVMHYVL